MSPQTIEALNQLNTLFYSQNAVSFGATRQRPWDGWQDLLEYMPQKPFRLLDIGCGNGRFEVFLRAKHIQLSLYMGIDSSTSLLEDARKQVEGEYERVFKRVDIVASKNWLEMPGSFDVAVLLAVVHHIPSKQLRQNAINRAAELLKPGGILIVSLWHYDTDARFSHKIIPWDYAPQISQSELEAGDYLLSWNNEQSKMRYVHVFNKTEVDDLVRASGLELLKSFNADGKNQQLNQYFVLVNSRVQ